jgi:DNA repair exonuclease SbcCD ATPase subunit
VWTSENNLVRLSRRQLVHQLEPARNRLERYSAEAQKLEQRVLNQDSTGLVREVIVRQRRNFLQTCIAQIESELDEEHEKVDPRKTRVSERASRITRTSISSLMHLCYFDKFDPDEARDSDRCVLMCSPTHKLSALKTELASLPSQN